jgi:hypothetical protein
VKIISADERLAVRMSSRQAAGGFAFYVVFGGAIERAIADKIIAHPLVRAGLRRSVSRSRSNVAQDGG